MCMFCRSVFALFHLAIVLYVLLFTDSDYPFDIFRLFFIQIVVSDDEQYHRCSICKRSFTYPRFDSKIQVKMIPGLARAMERTMDLSIIFY